MTRKPQKDILKESMKLLNHWTKRETKMRLKQQLTKQPKVIKPQERKIKISQPLKK